MKLSKPKIFSALDRRVARFEQLVYGVDKVWLTQGEKNVLVRIGLLGNSDREEFRPSYSLLARDCGLSRRGVIEIIKRLVEKCFLFKRSSKLNNVLATNFYIVKCERLKSCQRPVSKWKQKELLKEIDKLRNEKRENDEIKGNSDSAI